MRDYCPCCYQTKYAASKPENRIEAFKLLYEKVGGPVRLDDVKGDLGVLNAFRQMKADGYVTVHNKQIDGAMSAFGVPKNITVYYLTKRGVDFIQAAGFNVEDIYKRMRKAS